MHANVHVAEEFQARVCQRLTLYTEGSGMQSRRTLRLQK